MGLQFRILTKFITLNCAKTHTFLTSASFISSYSGANGKGDQWNRSYKENDTYTAPTSDRVERLGYSPSYGSVSNVNSPNLYSLTISRNIVLLHGFLYFDFQVISQFWRWLRIQPDENRLGWRCTRCYYRHWRSLDHTKSGGKLEWWRIWLWWQQLQKCWWWWSNWHLRNASQIGSNLGKRQYWLNKLYATCCLYVCSPVSLSQQNGHCRPNRSNCQHFIRVSNPKYIEFNGSIEKLPFDS